MKHAYQFMYKVFKIVKETSGLVIIRMKTSCPIGHSVFILIITKPSVFNYHGNFPVNIVKFASDSFIDMIDRTFVQIYKSGQDLSFDDGFCPFKGRSKF